MTKTKKLSLMEKIEKHAKEHFCTDPTGFENIMYDHTPEYSEKFAEENPNTESVIVFHDDSGGEDIAVFDAYTNQLLWINPEYAVKIIMEETTL